MRLPRRPGRAPGLWLSTVTDTVDAPPVVPAPEAPAGAGDVTRRFAVRGSGRDLFAGLTRPEAQATATALAALPPDEWAVCLVAIRLPVLLTDAAGPHLLDADGRITLALGPHPHIAGARVAMGEPFGRRALHRLGALRRLGEGPLWRWLAHASVPHAQRVAALDDLAGCGAEDELTAWGARWSGTAEAE